MQFNPRKEFPGSVLREAIEYAAAVEQSNLVLSAITSGLHLVFFIAANDTREVLYSNYAATSLFALSGKFPRQILKLPVRPAMEFQFMFQDSTHYYTVTTYPILWTELRATAYLVHDVTAEKTAPRKVYAYQDALTGLDNRLAGIMTLNKWLDQKREFSVCLANLDNVRYINNTYGRGEGDLCIRLVAEHLTEALATAHVCKMRGDEFLILIPDKGLAASDDAIRALDAQIKSETDNLPYLLNLSYGVVEVENGNQKSASEILSLVDERMQKSKLDGKKHRMLDFDKD